MKTISALVTAFTRLPVSPSQAGSCVNFPPALIIGRPSVTATVLLLRQITVVSVVDEVDTERRYTWTVSTGKTGYAIPTGTWKPKWRSRDHWPKACNAPIPFAVFFHGDYAIHAIDATSRLGQPASQGCVRVAPDIAALFFETVKTYGKANTEIVITG